MLAIVSKKLKRLTRMRFRRNFAITQCLLIACILVLAKRSRDRHKMAERSVYSDVIAPVQVELGAGADLLEGGADLVVPHENLSGSQGVPDEVIVGAPMGEDPGIQPPVGDVLVQPAENQNSQAAGIPPAVGEDAAGGYHFPEAGAEMALGAIDPVPDQPLGALEGMPPAQYEVVQDLVQEQPWDPAQGAAAGEELGWQAGPQYQDAPADVEGAQYPEGQEWDGAVQYEGGNAQAQDWQQYGEGQQWAPVEVPPPVYDERGLEILPEPEMYPELDPSWFSLQVTEDMINNFQVKLPPLLENYKNPCWIEQVPDGFTYDDSFFNTCHYVLHTNKLKHGAQYKAFEAVLLNRTARGDRTRVRCFPYFFLIGVGKCATTDVFDTLKKYFTEMAPIFLKEPHYWEWKRCIDKMLCRGEHRTPTFAEYLDSFDSSSDYLRERYVTQPDGSHYHDMVIGDFTPSTLAFHPCWRLMPGNQDKDEPRFINAHYIRSIRPETKFIAVMRDPVERIFSNFRMRDRMSADEKHNDAEVFHREMVNIIEYLNACMETKSARACAYTLMKFDYGTHVTNSMYELFISDWFKLFPRDQFLFIRMEDYVVDRVKTFRDIVNFLGLTPMGPESEMMIGAKSAVNQAPPAAMYNETRSMLQQFFSPYNRRLADLLGDESWTWGY